MGFLKLIGAVSAAEHERIVAENDEKAYAAWAKIADERDDLKMRCDDLQQKHNSVVSKLRIADNQTMAAMRARDEALKNNAAQANKIEQLTVELAGQVIVANMLRPDAEKWRDRAARELQRGQAKRDAKVIDAAMTGKSRKGRGK